MNVNKQTDFDTAALSTGLPQLDKMLGGGLHAGSLSVIAARPAMGKTSFALQLARNIAAAGKHVLLFSFDLQKEHVLQRYKKAYGSLPASDMLHVYDIADGVAPIDADAIRERVSSLEKCDAVFIDSLQMLTREPSRDVITDGIRPLKQLARSANIPVTVTGWLPRARIEQSKSHRPIPSDLGDTALYADVVIFPFRAAYYRDGQGDEGKAELIVAKNLYGATGIIPAYWSYDKLIFEEQTE